MINFLKKINDKVTKICATAERQVLKVLDGDCETAIGVTSFVHENKISLAAELFSIDGEERHYIKSSKELNLAAELGKEVGEILKKKSKDSYKK